MSFSSPASRALTPSHDLRQYLRSHRDTGVSVPLVLSFARQTLTALHVLSSVGIIHTDVKPENILLATPTAVKLIDLGSACFENYPLHTYIQSRHYRAPEVVLGARYTQAIDMWSFGCVVAELFLGAPLFPAESEYELVAQFVALLGPPPDALLAAGKHAGRFFKYIASAHRWRLKEPFEIEMEGGGSPRGVRCSTDLKELILKSTLCVAFAPDNNLPGLRPCLYDVLRRVFTYDAGERLTPGQALCHPLFACPLHQMTRETAALYAPTPRDAPHLSPCHGATSTPLEMLGDAYEADTDAAPLEQSLSRADYYCVFFRLLNAGHVANVTINNPLTTGSITPQPFVDALRFQAPAAHRNSTPFPPRRRVLGHAQARKSVDNQFPELAHPPDALAPPKGTPALAPPHPGRPGADLFAHG